MELGLRMISFDADLGGYAVLAVAEATGADLVGVFVLEKGSLTLKNGVGWSDDAGAELADPTGDGDRTERLVSICAGDAGAISNAPERKSRRPPSTVASTVYLLPAAPQDSETSNVAAAKRPATVAVTGGRSAPLSATTKVTSVSSGRPDSDMVARCPAIISSASPYDGVPA